MSTAGLRLEEALASPAARPEEVLDLVDEAVERAAADGDGKTLDDLARRLDEAASARGGEWRGLAVAAMRARALARAAGRPAPADSAAPPPAAPEPAAEPAAPPAPAYASWWSRVFAFLLDLFAAGFAIAVFDGVTGVVSGWLDLALVLAYFAVFPAVADGVTPGKAAFGLAIRVADGSPVDLVRSTWRAVAAALLWVTVIGFVVDLIMMGADPRRQSAHDKLAGTIVVRTRP